MEAFIIPYTKLEKNNAKMYVYYTKNYSNKSKTRFEKIVSHLLRKFRCPVIKGSEVNNNRHIRSWFVATREILRVWLSRYFLTSLFLDSAVSSERSPFETNAYWITSGACINILSTEEGK